VTAGLSSSVSSFLRLSVSGSKSVSGCAGSSLVVKVENGCIISSVGSGSVILLISGYINNKNI